ncbi:MAG: DUF2786 domain-containing protein [Planctomycetales bacterium]|nr:DUF2786 domain-containing protein [Planctomycetales bacterium]
MSKGIKVEFVWHDGGRAACGFVGMTGDCVTRAISIATGKVYRDVYQQLGERALKTPRNGVTLDIYRDLLDSLGWSMCPGSNIPFIPQVLPKGSVIAQLKSSNSRGDGGHLCAVIDHVIHDTWNPADDDYILVNYWVPPLSAVSTSTMPTEQGRRPSSREQQLTQSEFDKILRRLKALDNTANNRASTDGEKHNALRMMQSLMLTHNLTREDISDDDNVSNVQFTRIACPVNGRRACAWEKSLAHYVTKHVFQTVLYYIDTKGHRTFFWFYGPLSDVQNCIALFRELLLTIATAAHLQYGGHVRGSGASYAEGYVAGLPRAETEPAAVNGKLVSERALIHSRSLALHQAAKEWLDLECNIQLVSGKSSGRYQYDPAAAGHGKVHGAKHEIKVPGQIKRIGHK